MDAGILLERQLLVVGEYLYTLTFFPLVVFSVLCVGAGGLKLRYEAIHEEIWLPAGHNDGLCDSRP